MNNVKNRVDKLMIEGYNNKENFMELANAAVRTYGIVEDESKIIEVIKDVSLSMALGEAASKNKYLLTGGLIGAGLTVVGVCVVNTFKKISRDKKEMKELED